MRQLSQMTQKNISHLVVCHSFFCDCKLLCQIVDLPPSVICTQPLLILLAWSAASATAQRMFLYVLYY